MTPRPRRRSRRGRSRGDVTVPGRQVDRAPRAAPRRARRRHDRRPRVLGRRRRPRDARGGARASARRSRTTATRVRVTGAGLELGADRRRAIDCANSGTTMRLGDGPGRRRRRVAARSTATRSLRRRPMERVAEPLRAMGARIETTDGRAAASGWRAARSTAIDVDAAGGERAGEVGGAARRAARARHDARRRAAGEPRPHRAPARAHGRRGRARGDGSVALGGRAATPGGRRSPLPGDPSSAAFLVVAALHRARAPSVRVRDVGLNPTRTGALAILRRMGADIRVERGASEAGRAARRSRRARRRGSAARPSRPTRCRRRSTSCRSWRSPRRCADGETRIARRRASCA